MKRKILYILLSAAIAFAMWFYVVTTVNPESEETYYNISVVLENESVLHSHGLMILGEDTPKVALRLQGNRTDLVNLNSSNITLLANLANIYEVGEQRLTYTISYPGNVPNNAIEVVSKNPQTITLTIVERKSKEVPVVVEYAGKLDDGYYADTQNQTLSHETISLVGPAQYIDQIAEAKIVVNLDGRTASIDEKMTYTFCDAEGKPVENIRQVEASVNEIDLHLDILRYKEIQLKVEGISGGGIVFKDNMIQLDMTTIEIAGTEEALAKVGDMLKIGEIDLAKILKDSVLEFEIKLPEGIKNLTNKDTVSVAVDIPELETKTIRVTNIETKGLPSSMKATVQTVQCSVTFRGAAGQLEALKAEDVMIRVDLTNADPNIGSYPAEAIFNTSLFKDIGVIGNININVRITSNQT